jgi:hypothetical protein
MDIPQLGGIAAHNGGLPKSYAAGLKMNRPGGACISPGQ